MDGRAIPASVRGDRWVLHFYTEADHPWLGRLLDLRAGCAGRPAREWEARLERTAEEGLHPSRRRFAAAVLAALSGTEVGTGVAPAVVRRAVFDAAAGRPGEREAALKEAARRLALPVAEVERSLFADLPEERLVAPASVSSAELAVRANLALVRSALRRAEAVRLRVHGHARALVKYARLRGLLCSVRARPGETSADLEVSGPLALFRRTVVYGRALGDLVPHLAWCRSFHLEADCVAGGRKAVLELRTGDPFLPSRPPQAFDSAVEERLARDLAQEAPEWEVVREPAPVQAGERLVFPDFALVSRDDPARCWFVEVVGFWTRDYLDRKLGDYRRARMDRLVLCVDADRRCGDEDLPEGARVVRYRRRVLAAEVLRAMGAG